MSNPSSNAQSQIQSAPPKKGLIPAAEFGAKYKSKREVYNFLAVDSDVFLPAYGKCSTPGGLIR